VEKRLSMLREQDEDKMRTRASEEVEILDDYSVDGVSIYSKEAIKFHKKIVKIREKYHLPDLPERQTV
jgi:hypothetical protein